MVSGDLQGMSVVRRPRQMRSKAQHFCGMSGRRQKILRSQLGVFAQSSFNVAPRRSKMRSTAPPTAARLTKFVGFQAKAQLAVAAPAPSGPNERQKPKKCDIPRNLSEPRSSKARRMSCPLAPKPLVSPAINVVMALNIGQPVGDPVDRSAHQSKGAAPC